jgi:hypothetical protein
VRSGAMTRSMRSHLTVSNVLSVVAVFAALGGTSYAAVKVSKNSVGASQIKTNAVGSSEVKNGSLRKVDLRASDLPTGPVGPIGLAGAQGPKGANGDAGDTGAPHPVTVQFEQAAADLADGTSASYNAFCPEGMQGVGGGFRGDATDSEATNVGSSRPAMAPPPPNSNTEPPLDGQPYRGWRITVQNNAGGVTTGIRPEVWVACVPFP